MIMLRLFYTISFSVLYLGAYALKGGQMWRRRFEILIPEYNSFYCNKSQQLGAQHCFGNIFEQLTTSIHTSIIRLGHNI
jgi:hypothetical protein